MITNARKIDLIIVVDDLRFWKSFKQFSKEQGGGGEGGERGRP